MRPIIFRLTPLSGGAYRLISWPEMSNRCLFWCASMWSSSTRGVFDPKTIVDTASAGESGWQHFSLSCTYKCKRVPLIHLLCTSVPYFSISFVVLIFLYISFDLVRLGPPIGIDSMSSFQFGPPSFNFRIGLKRINLFDTKVSIFANLSFNWKC